MRTCPKCGKEWSDFELMTKGGIEIKGDEMDFLKCPDCGTRSRNKMRTKEKDYYIDRVILLLYGWFAGIVTALAYVWFFII